MYSVYILRCADGSYYVGLSENPSERIRTHNDGRGSSYTAKHLPVEPVYRETCGSFQGALKRERQIKGWTRAKKEALIAGDYKLLKLL